MAIFRIIRIIHNLAEFLTLNWAIYKRMFNFPVGIVFIVFPQLFTNVMIDTYLNNVQFNVKYCKRSYLTEKPSISGHIGLSSETI